MQTKAKRLKSVDVNKSKTAKINRCKQKQNA